jgi:hypothetical protein
LGNCSRIQRLDSCETPRRRKPRNKIDFRRFYVIQNQIIIIHLEKFP